MPHSSPAPPPSPTDFSLMVNRHQGAIYGFLYNLVADSEQARDLTQDTFYDAWRAVCLSDSSFLMTDSQQIIRRWLFRAAYHRAISLLRRNRVIRFESLEARNEQNPEQFAERSSFEEDFAQREVMYHALANLSPPDVACLLLRVVQGFSAAEVSEIIGVSPDTINKRLSRAKQRLRAAYLAQEAAVQQPRPRKDDRR